ncbi:HAMP domain-containing histidine kinase [Nostocaceae cyanobacterium CENA357]|uniref:histidine kinase n=1 Tax=Atlanticothrix silvestris CENA357 TaxID=1725252 RepID=A0A8J7HFC2_9CYAN|nr:HAMP domain-containing sensor histidine kinase [Atlanticothrix silvestris]MBH8551466.1 HAMP domain-containing histidine kinase [Atlanticothrix silvestris CENA357]
MNKAITHRRDRKSDTTMSRVLIVWQQIFGEARTRILLWYLLILGITFLIAIPAFRYQLYQRIDERVRRDMVADMMDFKALMNGESLIRENTLNNDASQEMVIEPEPLKWFSSGNEQITTPASAEDVMKLFGAYLLYRRPEDDSYFITFIDGEFYKSSPLARPKPLAQDSQLMKRWAKQTQPEQGEKEFSVTDACKILYMVEPIKINGQTRGVFIIAHTTAGERAEALEAVGVIIEVSSLVFIVSLTLAWLAAGRVLAPLRTITTTAHAISESDLTQRLPVRGKGELGKLATTFNEMMDRLEAAFATQREFVNDAGHELRTPITIVRGHLELMGDDPQEQQETLALVIGELDRMSRLVDDMILLAKAERIDFLQVATVNVAEFTQELFVKAQALAERDWQLDSVAKGRIVVDRQRITEAVMNLAQNATQHTGNSDTISIGSAIAKGKVRFWVRDTGEGIPLVDQKRIFERFARTSNSRRRSEGAGLGLSIVRAIAESHGGQVLLRSQLGTGSMFTIVLPLDPPK